jgi:hypothetical protein
VVRRTVNTPVEAEQAVIEALRVGRRKIENPAWSQPLERRAQEAAGIGDMFQELDHRDDIETLPGESLITTRFFGNRPSSAPAIFQGPEVNFGAVTAPAMSLSRVEQAALSKAYIDQASRAAECLKRHDQAIERRGRSLRYMERSLLVIVLVDLVSERLIGQQSR